ncbi:hypothetical protein AB834_04325 [PVC group bacterium (ex Bugula neritina AB1)]|nr:hypothetical protein AB834_04325 [PVC group bacterium (ex Bugula neritina AB1)]
MQKVKHQPVGDFSIADMFVGILDEHVSPQQEMSLKCSGCDLTYDEFSIQGRFGCSKCYNAFQVHLPALLKNIQRTFLHVGKTQMSRPKSTDALRDELKKELAMAIKKENYERAAQLRDKLRGMVD